MIDVCASNNRECLQRTNHCPTNRPRFINTLSQTLPHLVAGSAKSMPQM
jgi:hypothetical protein